MRKFYIRWTIEFVLMSALVIMVLHLNTDTTGAFVFQAISVIAIVFFTAFIFSMEESMLVVYLEDDDEDEVYTNDDEIYMDIDNDRKGLERNCYYILNNRELNHLHKFPNEAFDDIYVVVSGGTRNIDHSRTYVAPSHIVDTINSVFIKGKFCTCRVMSDNDIVIVGDVKYHRVCNKVVVD